MRFTGCLLILMVGTHSSCWPGEFSLGFSSRALGAATVGTPVTRRPPYRPGRAVCPHPVPRLHSLPCRRGPFPGTLCLREPAGRLAHLTPVRHGRDEVPGRAAGCRRVLPRVVGLPSRCVRCSRRLPLRLRRAFPLPVLLRLPVGRFASTVQFPHRSGSGLPLVGPQSCLPPLETSRSQERRGLPSSCTSLFLHATA